MKHIKIQNIDKPDKSSVYTKKHYYSIYLGHERWFYFKNEVKAKRFIAETNRFYNSTLHEYNYIFAQLLIEYRNIWFYVDDKFTREMQQNINELEKSFTLVILKSSHHINGNPLTFQYLKRIHSLLHDIAISLRNAKFEKD
jgi:hypothetical protein